FPPTYKGGYERLYKKIDEVFSWEGCEYEEFNEERFATFQKLITEREDWLTLRDYRVESLEPFLKGIVQTGVRSKPVYVYGATGKSPLALPRKKTEPLLIPRFSPQDEITENSTLSLAPITQPQMNLLRSEYLAQGIVPAPALFNLGVLVDGKLFGALGFARPQFGGYDTYMMTDFAIRPLGYKKASKLVIAASLSNELKEIAQERLSSRVQTIMTTAFTTKADSMKYRGLYDV